MMVPLSEWGPVLAGTPSPWISQAAGAGVEKARTSCVARSEHCSSRLRAAECPPDPSPVEQGQEEPAVWPLTCAAVGWTDAG